MANIIADPTTAGKIYEFVGYGSKSVEKYMYAVYLSLSLSPPPSSLPPSLPLSSQTKGLPIAGVGTVHVSGYVQKM